MNRSSALVIVAALALVQPHGSAQGPIGVQEPAWAPDGKRIAVSYLDRIWVMTPEGKQARALTPPDTVAIEREPVWSQIGRAHV